MALKNGQSERTFTVYCHTNSTNGKKYVGVTCQTMGKRWSRHVYDAKKGGTYHLHRAIRQCGVASFTHEVVATFSDESEALEAEKFYIRTWRTFDSEVGYNATLGGEMHTHSDETKVKISESSTLRWADAESRQKIVSKMKENAATPERKASRSVASRSRKGERRSDDGRANISVAQQERFSDPTQRSAVGSRLKQLWADPSYREMILKARKEARHGSR